MGSPVIASEAQSAREPPAPMAPPPLDVEGEPPAPDDAAAATISEREPHAAREARDVITPKKRSAPLFFTYIRAPDF